MISQVRKCFKNEIFKKKFLSNEEIAKSIEVNLMIDLPTLWNNKINVVSIRKFFYIKVVKLIQ